MVSSSRSTAGRMAGHDYSCGAGAQWRTRAPRALRRASRRRARARAASPGGADPRGGRGHAVPVARRPRRRARTRRAATPRRCAAPRRSTRSQLVEELDRALGVAQLEQRLDQHVHPVEVRLAVAEWGRRAQALDAPLEARRRSGARSTSASTTARSRSSRPPCISIEARRQRVERAVAVSVGEQHGRGAELRGELTREEGRLPAPRDQAPQHRRARARRAKLAGEPGLLGPQRSRTTTASATTPQTRSHAERGQRPARVRVARGIPDGSRDQRDPQQRGRRRAQRARVATSGAPRSVRTTSRASSGMSSGRRTTRWRRMPSRSNRGPCDACGGCTRPRRRASRSRRAAVAVLGVQEPVVRPLGRRRRDRLGRSSRPSRPPRCSRASGTAPSRSATSKRARAHGPVRPHAVPGARAPQGAAGRDDRRHAPRRRGARRRATTRTPSPSRRCERSSATPCSRRRARESPTPNEIPAGGGARVLRRAQGRLPRSGAAAGLGHRARRPRLRRPPCSSAARKATPAQWGELVRDEVHRRPAPGRPTPARHGGRSRLRRPAGRRARGQPARTRGGPRRGLRDRQAWARSSAAW